MLVTYLFYGLYIPIFASAVHLLRQDIFEFRKIYLTCTIALFVISTLTVIDDTFMAIQHAILQFDTLKTQDWESYNNWLIKQNLKAASTTIFYFLPPFANLAAETMLIHRCYIIWGSSKRVGIPLAVTSVLGSLTSIVGAVLVGIGIGGDTTVERNLFLAAVGEQTSMAGLLLSVLVNICITLLTAGRIWWINRESKIYLGVQSDNKLQHTMRIIIESGLMYPTAMVAQLINANVQKDFWAPVPVDLVPVVIISAAIAPALVIVRAQVDKTLERARTKRDPGLSDLQFKMPSSFTRGNTTRSTSYHLKSVGQPERKQARKSDAAVPLLSVNEDVEPMVEDENENEQDDL
ncbi:hypothetical protein V5O48_016407 [Marasmius crinis-equi]|uniref:Uncharacterized protein n=1 Tax=Marasmius crinis-equi TaxID=585013 RepID=A0ABR3ERY2_9AGAR